MYFQVKDAVARKEQDMFIQSLSDVPTDKVVKMMDKLIADYTKLLSDIER